MIELRTCTLATRKALDQDATVQSKRHIPSLAAMGVTMHDILSVDSIYVGSASSHPGK